MEFIKDTNLQFMQHRRTAVIVSVILLITSIAFITLRGLSFGVDFTGGTVIEIGYADTADLSEIRARLKSVGFDDFEVQYFGTAKDIVIRLAPEETVESAELSNTVLDALQTDGEALQMRRVEYVGPKVGAELREDGGLAMLYALIGILIYVAFRFEYRFAIGSVIALLHDVILTIGFFSVTGIDFDLSVLAAILAVIGYSLNDTIVIYDRIRENFMKQKRATTEAVINLSINQTLARTVVTSLTTMVVLVALLVFGGEGLVPFTAAMIVGIIVGTYSSVFISGASLMLFNLQQKDMQAVKKEGEEFGRV